MTIAYGVCLVLSMLVLVYMAQKNYENVNVQYWSIVILIPVLEAAYFLSALVTTAEAAYVLCCFKCIESTILISLFLFLLLRIIKVRVKPWWKILSYGLAFTHILIVICGFNTANYFKDIQISKNGHGNAIKTIVGPMMYFHYAYILLAFIVLVTIIVIGFMRKGTYSIRALTLNTILIMTGLSIHIIEDLVEAEFSVLPLLYLITEVIFVLVYNYSRMHEINGLISAQQSSDTVKGYMAISLKRRFLGCNEKCKEFLPLLKEQRIDEMFPKDSEFRVRLDLFIDAFEQGKRDSARFEIGERIWICDISHFSILDDGTNQGYLLEIRDATEEERTYSIIKDYNATLNAEVRQKTEYIRSIQKNVLIGMANLIENRDSSTGGHVKRTSDVVRILIDEINRIGNTRIDKKKAEYIVSSAPMHDLGKISIDSYILCKPGKLTDEEFAIMKSHAVKSGEIVNILMEGVEEKDFVETCYNVARYHHEKWDGTGYPEGLKGEEIPIGARVMAVADVLDALLCKRCYKEPMSFSEASKIMLDGMGKSFDPDMEIVFLNCREKLEEYYKTVKM